MNALAQAESLAAGLPRLLLAAERLAHVAAPGAHGRRVAGRGDDFWQFRDFGDGDEVPRIDWRRSAAGGRLLVREREFEAQASVALALVDGPGMDFCSNGLAPKRERAVLILLGLACLLLAAGERVALAGVTPPLTGRAALRRLALALATGETAPPAVRARRIVFGDFLAPDPVFAGPAGGAVVQILDPAECDFPYRGRIVFEGFGPPVETGRAEAWRAAYQARLSARRAEVAAAARRAGQVPLFHRTDAPPATVLAALHQALSRV